MRLLTPAFLTIMDRKPLRIMLWRIKSQVRVNLVPRDRVGQARKPIVSGAARWNLSNEEQSASFGLPPGVHQNTSPLLSYKREGKDLGCEIR